MRTFRCRPGQRTVIDTACATAQSYLVRILAVRLGAGANYVVPRLVFTPTLSPDDAWCTSGSAPPFRFDPNTAFSLSVGGSLYLESSNLAEVSGISLPTGAESEIDYDVTTFGTGLNDSIHAASSSLTCSFILPRAQSPTWSSLPVGSYEVELAGDAAFASVLLRFTAGGFTYDTVVGRAAGARASLGYANTLTLPNPSPTDGLLQFRVRLPGSVA